MNPRYRGPDYLDTTSVTFEVIDPDMLMKPECIGLCLLCRCTSDVNCRCPRQELTSFRYVEDAGFGSERRWLQHQCAELIVVEVTMLTYSSVMDPR